MKEVILVNLQDEIVGSMEKMEAHQKGILHRAFSVFLFNSEDELLLQRRAMHKYHSGGLWTNTCCSHPAPGETIMNAAKRRLVEEMGIVADLKLIDSFIYKAHLDNGLIEHEYDHLLTGNYNGEVALVNQEEVMDFKWIAFDALQQSVNSFPDQFTVWFIKVYQDIFKKYLEDKKI
ncbi:isopentenyl-diphosphate Delta-isomerase [Olivibacter sp. SDN3]|uniref:isopentenyl-diphosphate Delta-isomerase n=1 Tax=Olivibacter sp. SDN3 TaxID=2764720 RepID=UPI0016518B7F|nr:isopentenyl-diphosphate Delta-isomerase [Olivibacter sp. SDN3]QNL48871.1 isopentenyl-diphosphate Delta-isomerase [Olivibacter sp. SDN3]